MRIRVAWIVFAVIAANLPGQDAEKKEPDPEVEAKLELFDDAISHKDFALDGKAVQIIDELLQKYEGMHPKDQRDFFKALDKVFKIRKRKPNQPALYEATVFALGTVGGKDASRLLTQVYKKKPFDDEEWRDLQIKILENVGRTKDERQIDFLLDRATRDPVDPIKAKAGGALRHYFEAKESVRKDIVKKLLIDYGKIEGGARSLELNSEIAATRKRTLAAIRPPWNTTLSKLTGQNLQKAEDWQHWWNKNKNKKWQ